MEHTTFADNTSESDPEMPALEEYPEQIVEVNQVNIDNNCEFALCNNNANDRCQWCLNKNRNNSDHRWVSDRRWIERFVYTADDRCQVCLYIPETQDQDDNDCSSSVVSTLSIGSSINDNNGDNESNSATVAGSSVTELPTDDPITPQLDNNNSDTDSDDIDWNYWRELSNLFDLYTQ